VHDNPGAGLVVRGQATALVAHNEFRSNGTSERAPAAMLVELGARPVFRSNVFRHIDPQSVTLLDEASRARLKDANLFPDAGPATAGARGRGHGQ
jgi:hypothetical protein